MRGVVLVSITVGIEQSSFPQEKNVRETRICLGSRHRKGFRQRSKDPVEHKIHGRTANKTLKKKQLLTVTDCRRRMKYTLSPSLNTMFVEC